MSGSFAADPETGLGAQVLTERRNVRGGLGARAEDADRQSDGRRIEYLGSLGNLLDRQAWGRPLAPPT